MTNTVAKNYLGIDYGQVRIGLAVANGEARIASPLKTVVNSQDPVVVIKDVVSTQDIGTIVVGLPRSLAGIDTPQTKIVRQFIEQLSSIVGLPVIPQDEAGTSGEAKARIGRKKAQKGDIDSEAATIILQDYLDNLSYGSQE